MAEPIIYLITNSINDKVYIGQTTDLKERIRRYRYAAKPDAKIKCEQEIMRVMRKLGFDNFSFQTIEICNSYEAGDLAEVKWIKHYRSNESEFGYNREPGGKCKRRELSKTEFRHSKEHKLKMSKAIVAFKNSVFRIYPSAKEYASEVGCDRSIISAAMRKGGKYKKAFFYYCDDEKRKETMKNNRDKKRYTEIGKVVNEIGIDEIDGFIFLTRELVDLEDRIL